MPTENTQADRADHHGGAEPGTGLAFVLAIVLVVVWAGSIALFGVPGLFVPAVILTPIILIVLVAISSG